MLKIIMALNLGRFNFILRGHHLLIILLDKATIWCMHKSPEFVPVFGLPSLVLILSIVFRLLFLPITLLLSCQKQSPSAKFIVCSLYIMIFKILHLRLDSFSMMWVFNLIQVVVFLLVIIRIRPS